MHERVALVSPAFDPREAARCFMRKLDGRPDTAIAAGALHLKPGAPVLLEHNPDRPVGRIRTLYLMPWADGLTWHAALVELDSDDWPSDQRVSIGYAPLRETTLLDKRRIIESAIVDEISLVHRNAIPGARLLPPTTEGTTPGHRRIPSASGTATPRTLIRRGLGEIIAIR